WLMSPVWIMKAGFWDNALTLLMASSSVPSALGLAGLSKPALLSLVCRKGKTRLFADRAPPLIPRECGNPPATVHSTPVPHQVMHSRILRLLTPSRWSNSLICESPFSRCPPNQFGRAAFRRGISQNLDLFPDSARNSCVKVPSWHRLRLTRGAF